MDLLDYAALPGYVVTIVFVCLAPGPDLAYLVSVSVAEGRWAGVRAAAGAALGTTLHVVVVAFGLALIAGLHPGWLAGVHVGAAAYLTWVGLGMIGSARGESVLATDTARPAGSRIFWPACVNSLCNMSALLFIAALLPEFVDPTLGRIRLQMLVLGLIFMITAWLVETGFGLLAAQAHTLAARHGSVLPWVARISGGLLVVLAALSVIQAVSIVRTPSG